MIMKTTNNRILLTLMFAVFFGVSPMFISCSSQRNLGQRAEKLEPNYSTPSFVINSHQHSRDTEEWERKFVDVHRKFNAMACVFWPMERAEEGIAFAKAHSDLVIPYIQIPLDSPTVLDDIKKAHAMGYKGFGEIPRGNIFRYDDLRYEPIWTLLEDLGMVVLFHTGVRGSGIFDLLRPATLATIAAKHPDLNIVGAHMGNPWYDEAAEGVE